MDSVSGETDNRQQGKKVGLLGAYIAWYQNKVESFIDVLVCVCLCLSKNKNRVFVCGKFKSSRRARAMLLTQLRLVFKRMQGDNNNLLYIYYYHFLVSYRYSTDVIAIIFYLLLIIIIWPLCSQLFIFLLMDNKWSTWGMLSKSNKDSSTIIKSRIIIHISFTCITHFIIRSV